jgi:chromodomain-helicase-DNA-binding protein 4
VFATKDPHIITDALVATWDSPPLLGDASYPAFLNAMKRFLKAREVKVLKKTGTILQHFENRRRDEYRNKFSLKEAVDLDLGQDVGLTLMPFQV